MCRRWTTEQIELLRSLVQSGASAARASVVLKRPKLAVQNKARQLGQPFPDVRGVKAARLAREAVELETIERRRSAATNSGEVRSTEVRVLQRQ